jgi:hypothetical protein
VSKHESAPELSPALQGLMQQLASLPPEERTQLLASQAQPRPVAPEPPKQVLANVEGSTQPPYTHPSPQPIQLPPAPPMQAVPAPPVTKEEKMQDAPDAQKREEPLTCTITININENRVDLPEITNNNRPVRGMQIMELLEKLKDAVRLHCFNQEYVPPKPEETL